MGVCVCVCSSQSLPVNPVNHNLLEITMHYNFIHLQAFITITMSSNFGTERQGSIYITITTTLLMALFHVT